MGGPQVTLLRLRFWATVVIACHEGNRILFRWFLKAAVRMQAADREYRELRRWED